MKVQKEHKKATLMKWSKEELVTYIICLEHNINVLQDSFDNQYHNCVKMLGDMALVNKTYTDAKALIKESVRADNEQREITDK